MEYIAQIDMSGPVLTAIVGAFAALSGTIVYLHKLVVTRMDNERSEIKAEFRENKVATETEIKHLGALLLSTTKERDEANFKALRAEFKLQLPCHLLECPKRNMSFSVGEASLPEV